MVEYMIVSGTISGTNGSDGNAVFTLAVRPTYFQLFRNGALQSENVAFTRSGRTITFLAPFIPVVGDVLIASGEE